LIWLLDWLFGCVVGWSVHYKLIAHWLICLFDWLIGCVVGWLVGQLDVSDHVIIDKPTARPTSQPTNQHANHQTNNAANNSSINNDVGWVVLCWWIGHG